jgi:hypothetical protein
MGFVLPLTATVRYSRRDAPLRRGAARSPVPLSLAAVRAQSQAHELGSSDRGFSKNVPRLRGRARPIGVRLGFGTTSKALTSPRRPQRERLATGRIR